MATIYQELDLVADLRVADNIFLGHERRRRGFLDRARMRRETTDAAARASATSRSRPNTRVSDLRPAGQQIVSIARSLSHDVRLLIMDEPSAILDDSEIETLFEVVRRLTAEGVGVVYISHRLDEIRRIGDRVTVLRRGRDGGVGPPGQHAGRRARHPHGRAPAFEQLFPERADRRRPTSCSRCAACSASPT